MAFVGHGGIFGLQESIFHQVPMVIMPIWGDQFDNAKRIEEKGLGRVIWDKKNITQDIIEELLTDVLNKAKYIIQED